MQGWAVKKILSCVALCAVIGCLAFPAAARERVVQAKAQGRAHHESTSQPVPVVPVVADASLPAPSEGTPPAYREPLDAIARAQDDEAASADSRTQVLRFPVSPTRGQRFSQQAVALVSRGLVAAASEKTGVGTPVPSPSYQPYRPGMSVPEPATLELSCPPLGTPNAPARCSR